MIQYILGLLQAIISGSMSYVTAKYFLMVLLAVIIYYILPLKTRWVVLLIGSGYFFWELTNSIKEPAVFLFSIITSHVAGLLIYKYKKSSPSCISKLLLFIGILASTGPLVFSKFGRLLSNSINRIPAVDWIIPIGLSFYSMMIISYLVDVYNGKYAPQKNIFKFALYLSFFPIIIQGPISRYDQLGDELYEGHRYDYNNILSGLELVLWGFFLKYLIADKSAIIVNAVFDNHQAYSGLYVLVAAILYSIQLYTDFLSCVTISRGVAQLFGITLINNFNHPYFSTSVKDFWRRWHISLSTWLRDYIYIPLGGNRNGKVRKYINLAITFAISGIWHGESYKYLFWGLLHSFYQITGDIIAKPKDFLLGKMALPKGSAARKVFESIVTFILVMIGWIVFRADSLKIGIQMIISMFSCYNPWIFFDDSLYRLGLGQKEFNILLLSILILFIVSFLQEKGIRIRAWINRQNLLIRWGIYLLAIWSIWIFGTYGSGFNAADFIYGGF